MIIYYLITVIYNYNMFFFAGLYPAFDGYGIYFLFNKNVGNLLSLTILVNFFFRKIYII